MTLAWALLCRSLQMSPICLVPIPIVRICSFYPLLLADMLLLPIARTCSAGPSDNLASKGPFDAAFVFKPTPLCQPTTVDAATDTHSTK